MEAETTYAAILGSVLANLRTAKGMTQSDVAGKLGLHVSTWSRIEKGEGSISADQLRKAAEALGETPANIMAKAAVAEESARQQGIAITEKWSVALGKSALRGAATGMVIPIVGPVLGAIVGAAIAGVVHHTARTVEKKSQKQ